MGEVLLDDLRDHTALGLGARTRVAAVADDGSKTALALVRVELRLAPTVQAPSIARSQLTEQFAHELEHDELEDAKLLSSELVTNAVVHGHGDIQLSALLDDVRLTVEVIDQGEGFERTAPESGSGTVGGHGLNIVDALASRWGIQQGTSHIWFELERRRQRHGPVSA
jgi:anti-sigma regulatory factor (Ser/Thr protein kinase)